jgi:hypothetical protein
MDGRYGVETSLEVEEETLTKVSTIIVTEHGRAIKLHNEVVETTPTLNCISGWWIYCEKAQQGGRRIACANLLAHDHPP